MSTVISLSSIPESQSSLPPRVRIMGMPIDPVTEEQAIAHILDSLAAGRGGWVITPNLDQLRLYHETPELRGMYEVADLVLADGMPLLWASLFQRTPLPQRVAGSELINTLAASAAPARRSLFLLGGNPGAAEGAAAELARRHPEMGTIGVHCPPFGFEHRPEEMQRIVDRLRAARPDIVFVGLGFPKQERLIEAIHQQFPATWFLGVGVSLSFVCGEIRQAPLWMRRTGLEWVHRLFQEPGRLFGRYVVHDIPFALKLLVHVSGGRRCKGVR